MTRYQQCLQNTSASISNNKGDDDLEMALQIFCEAIHKVCQNWSGLFFSILMESKFKKLIHMKDSLAVILYIFLVGMKAVLIRK